uniref:R2 protein n=1 Tax=Lepidurus couesii TaxID=63726 RepID=I7BCK2_9CRUS|nr:R2 protein [Lepidurus couesii]
MSEESRPKQTASKRGAAVEKTMMSGTYVCTLCGRSFEKSVGLSLHTNRMHPEAYNKLKEAKKPVLKKARWSEEEVFLLAQKEAELSFIGGIKFMNIELHKIFPERELEGIKGQRKNPTYKAQVVSLLAEIRESKANDSSSSSSSSSSCDSASLGISNWLEFLLALPKTSNQFQEGRLDRLISDALRGVDVLENLDAYLLEVFAKPMAQNPCPKPPPPAKNSRERRDREYSRVQNFYKKNRSACINSILDGNTRSQNVIPGLTKFWTETFEKNSPPDDEAPDQFVADEPRDMYKWITFYEMSQDYLDSSTAPGVDGFSAKQLRSMSPRVLNKILNLLLLSENLPNSFKMHKTVLIPKIDDPKSPGDFRPITISPVLARLLNKILAARLSKLVPISQRQKAFLPVDGCGENIFLLDYILRSSKKSSKSVAMAVLDVKKAFDSVSHHSILRALNEAKCPINFINFVRNSYDGCTTKLTCGGTSFPDSVRMNRGVKQGDPLSPVLFNLIIDSAIRKLPDSIGYVIRDGLKINCLAYADDLILVASSRAGLKTLLNIVAEHLSLRGLDLNAAKCHGLSIIASGKAKTTYVSAADSLDLDGQPIKNLGVLDTWTYLGIPFSHLGRAEKVSPDLTNLLNKLQKAPLKLQQKLYAVRNFVIPRALHGLILSKTNLKELNTLDRAIRVFLRTLLYLPKDTPLGFFHSPIKSGGLGITCFRTSVLKCRLQRIARMRSSCDGVIQAVAESDIFADEYAKLRDLIRINGNVLDTTESIKRYWAQRLHSSVDGKTLAYMDYFPQGNLWMSEDKVSQRSYVFADCVKLRINAIPTRVRVSRGRPNKEMCCRAKCFDSQRMPAFESLNHITQVCPRTHGSRIQRHDKIAKFLFKNLNNCPSRSVLYEPHFVTVDGLRKPDIIIYDDSHMVVLDVQVVSDSANLEKEFECKAKKYANDVALRSAMLIKYPFIKSFSFVAATYNNRGLIAKSSVQVLRQLGLSPRSIMVSILICLEGTLETWRIFNQSTMNAH